MIWYSWLALLVLVPITSQPYLARFVGGRPVNPPSMVPAIVILLIGVLPFLLRGGGIPRPAIPLLLFAAVAAISTVLVPWLGLHPFQDVQVVDRSLRGVVSLGIGLSYYLSALYLPVTDDRLRSSLRAIAIGAVPMLLWALIQPIQFRPIPLRDVLDAVHEFLFSQRPLFRDRVTGMAVEPSWFADQLVLFYLPLWLASLLLRTGAFHRRGRYPWLETSLFLVGSLMLLLTFSRIGFAAWGAVWIALAAVAGWKAWPWLVDRLRIGGRARRGVDRVPVARMIRPLGPAIAILGVFLVAILLVVLTSQLESRMARVFSLDLDNSSMAAPSWFRIASQLEFAERITYWTAAGRVFSEHPVLGVGLGNSGFYFPQLVPAFGYSLPEVLTAVGVSPGTFPNPKSLWFRLLAETGIVGFVLYATWLVITFACGWDLRGRGAGLPSVIGVASILALIAFLFEGFSLDTFGLPHQWILFGMAAGNWARLAHPGPQP